jgi:hypothetical protein
MTDETNNLQQSPASQPLPPRAPLGDENDIVLALARQLAAAIDTPPDAILTPKNFVERFKFFDDGVDKKLYVWVNGAWQAFGSATSSAVTVARMWLNTSQNIPDGVMTKVEFDSISFEDGITADDSTNQFVVPADGYYRITAQILYGAPVDSTKIIGYIIINGVSGSPVSSSPAFIYQDAGSPMFLGVKLDDVLALTAGDTVEIHVFHTYFTAPPETLQAGENYTFCSIQKL